MDVGGGGRTLGELHPGDGVGDGGEDPVELTHRGLPVLAPEGTEGQRGRAGGGREADTTLTGPYVM